MTTVEQPGHSFGREHVTFLATRYLRHWHWFALSVLLCVGGMFAYLTTQKYTYEVRASILIRDEESPSTQKQDLMQELNVFGGPKRVDNELEIIKSVKLARQVVDDLNLTVNYSIRDQFRLKDIYNEVPISIHVLQPLAVAYDKPFDVTLGAGQAMIGGVACRFGKPVQSPLGLILVRRRGQPWRDNQGFTVAMARRQEVVRSYVEKLLIAQPNKNASVLYLTLEDTAPDRGIAYLNRLINVYESSSLQDKNRAAANTLRFVEARLRLLTRELTTVEAAIQQFKTQSGIVDLPAEATLFLEKVKDNDAQRSTVAIQLSTLSAIDAYLSGQSGAKSVAPSTLGLESPTLTNLINRLFEQETQRSKLIQTVPEQSVLVQTLDEQTRTTRRNLLDHMATLRTILLATQRNLQANNRRIESTIRTIPGKERHLLDISRQASIKGNLYDYLLQKREEAALSFAAAVSDLRVVDNADAEPNPVRPIRRNFLLFALVLGLTIPIVLLWSVDFFNSRISRRAQVEAATQTPIIGEIVLANAQRPPLEAVAPDRSLLAEQIRALRTNIQFFNPDGGKQTILITSSVSGEGKSFITLHLGASMAMAGKRVILLELDMRKPRLHRYLNQKNAAGVSSYLAGQATLDEIIQPVPDQPNLFFAACGLTPPNPSELLGGEKMRYLFENLHEHFDVIIADTPPVGLVTDASILARYSTTTLYVVRHLLTGKSFLKSIDTLYREKRFPNLCLLINGIHPKRDYEYNYGYGYDPNYGYTYRSGYHTDGEAPERKVPARGFGWNWFGGA